MLNLLLSNLYKKKKKILKIYVNILKTSDPNLGDEGSSSLIYS